MKLSFFGKLDKLKGRFKRVTVKTKVGYDNLNIEEKAAQAGSISKEGAKGFFSNLKTIFQKPTRHVSHFGLILVILVVLMSGVPAPEAMQKSDEIPVDPFGMIASTKAIEDEEIDISELEAVAMSASFINDEMANDVYKKIGENESDSQVILAGNTIANTSIISTKSSAKVDKLFEKYTVQNGDTLSQIATKFGVTTNSIKWSNGSIKDIDSLKPGTEINIPTVTGVLHTVKSGDSVASIASRYKANASLITEYNDLYGEDLVAGQTIIVPNGQVEDPKPTPTATIATTSRSSSSGGGRYGSSSSISASGNFRFPTIVGGSGYYNGYHWWAIDSPNSIGTPIYAADSGRIVEAKYGYNGGFGNTILIDHGNGFQTRYAHMTTLKILGGYVSKGQVIGYMGSTGRSTGSHLHFEVIYRGAKQNPMKYF